MLCNALLACGARHLSLVNPAFHEDRALNHYDTATRALKSATIDTGGTVNVPLFVEEGEFIRINTKTGEYVERVKQ